MDLSAVVACALFVAAVGAVIVWLIKKSKMPEESEREPKSAPEGDGRAGSPESTG